MKKAKIMLLTIAVIASVGSALAFKVQKLGSHTFCYLETATQPADGACTNTITGAAGSTSGITTYFYNDRPAGKTCAEATDLVCNQSAHSFVE